MRSVVVLLVGAALLSISEAASQDVTKVDLSSINGPLRHHKPSDHDATDEERLSITRLVFGPSKKIEKMLVDNPAQLDKYSIKTVTSKLKYTKHKAKALSYLNQRSDAIRNADRPT
ncbi:hypothetical protein GN244_ATG14609 [Phytophthora infestans]|uniref:RxLR effector protein n=1 Tax=Phytophthora infestans TaxID=4787 RepID=A0A833SUM6_PHYIN|nr:hypothetical protein GN244_ATG14609 [Phytophthora infestans]KAF4143030.1 hypothetical protein GN958_ATG07759 [Phytophthora infestans]